MTDVPVTGASEEGDGVALVTSLGEVRVGQLLVAAGAWTARVAALFGVHLHVELDVDMLSVTEPSPPIMTGILSHARGILTLKQFSNGSCIIGGGWQGHGGPRHGGQGDRLRVRHAQFAVGDEHSPRPVRPSCIAPVGWLRGGHTGFPSLFWAASRDPFCICLGMRPRRVDGSAPSLVD